MNEIHMLEDEWTIKKEIEYPLDRVRKMGDFIKEHKISLLLDYILNNLVEKYRIVATISRRFLKLLRRGEEEEKILPHLSLILSWQESILSDFEVIEETVKVIHLYVEELINFLSQRLNIFLPESERMAIETIFDNTHNFVREAMKRVDEMFYPHKVRLRRQERIDEAIVPFLVIQPSIVEHAFSPIVSIVAALEKIEEKVNEIISLAERKEKNGFLPYPTEFEERRKDVSQIFPEEVNKTRRLTLRKFTRFTE